MNIKNNLLERVEEVLMPLALPHTPEGTDTIAIIDQWIHALATNNEFYCDNSLNTAENLKKQIRSMLRKSKFYQNKTQFYNLVFDNIELKPNINSKFTFIDLFAGIGGTRLGAQLNSGSCVFSSEFDSFAQETYRFNFGEKPFGDICKIKSENIPHHDLLLAGFPCQPFSYAGRTEGFEDKTRGTLFFDILRILESKVPKAALLENVKGFKSHNKGQTMDIALKALDEAGYSTWWTILNSYDFGVPQYRERWYCVAIRKDLAAKNKFEFPTGEGRNVKLKDIVDKNLNNPNLKLKKFELDRIKYHLKKYKKTERVQHDNSMYEPHTKKGRHGVFSFMKPDGSIRFHVGDASKTQIQEAFYACLDTYAPTIIANRVPKLWDIERKLSVDESLKLQDFPKNFKFNVSNAQAYKQLGNSVTVSVVQRIIEKLGNIL